MISILVPERLAGFQCVLDALERLALATQFQERFALQIEEVLLADRRLVRQCAAGKNVGQRAADDRVVVANPPAAPGEMDPELQGGEHGVAANDDARAWRRTLVSLADAVERQFFRICHQTLAVHGDAVGLIEKPETPCVGGAGGDLGEPDRLEYALYERQQV